MLSKDAIVLNHNFVDNLQKGSFNLYFDISTYFTLLKSRDYEYKITDNTTVRSHVHFQGNTLIDTEKDIDVPTLAFMDMTDETINHIQTRAIQFAVPKLENLFYINGKNIFSLGNIKKLSHLNSFIIVENYDIVINSYTMDDCITNLKLLGDGI